MDIAISKTAEITVVKLAGDIDTNTASGVQEKVLPLAASGSKILIDMTDVAGKIVKVDKQAPVRQCGTRSNLELQQPVSLGFNDIKNIAILRDGQTVGAVHIACFLRDRSIWRQIKDLAVDHRARITDAFAAGEVRPTRPAAFRFRDAEQGA